MATVSTNPYSVQNYLLDKANIYDTVVRTGHLFDTCATASTIESVYTPKIYLDYHSVLGLSPELMPSEVWAKRLNQIHEPYDETQHLVQNILVNLPQPTGQRTSVRPERCEVLAYAQGWFYNRDSEGYPRQMVRRQGGRWKLEVVRLQELEDRGENPWRINKQQVTLSWQDRSG